MKKDKLYIAITLGIMSLILVCVMFAQFKVVRETDITQIESMRDDELEEAVLEWKEKYEKTAEKLSETKEMINEYDSKIQSNEESSELIQAELSEAKRIFGITETSGEGIIVTLTDTDDKIYAAEDLLDLVNELRASGAKAISINDERIVNTTDIVDIGSKYIVVNNNKITSPYVIKAIGEKTHLNSALTIRNGYYDIKNKAGYSINIQEKSNIKIEGYNKELELKYINN